MVTIGTMLAALFVLAPAGAAQPVELGDGVPQLSSSQAFDHARATRLPTRFDVEIAGGVARVSVTSTLSGLPGAIVEARPYMALIATRSERFQLIGVVLTALIIGVVRIWRLAMRQ